MARKSFRNRRLRRSRRIRGGDIITEDINNIVTRLNINDHNFSDILKEKFTNPVFVEEYNSIKDNSIRELQEFCNSNNIYSEAYDRLVAERRRHHDPL